MRSEAGSCPEATLTLLGNVNLTGSTSLAKIGILIGSILSVVTGFAFLRAVSARAEQPIEEVQKV